MKFYPLESVVSLNIFLRFKYAPRRSILSSFRVHRLRVRTTCNTGFFVHVFHIFACALPSSHVFPFPFHTKISRRHLDSRQLTAETTRDILTVGESLVNSH